MTVTNSLRHTEGISLRHTEGISLRHTEGITNGTCREYFRQRFTYYLLRYPRSMVSYYAYKDIAVYYRCLRNNKNNQQMP